MMASEKRRSTATRTTRPRRRRRRSTEPDPTWTDEAFWEALRHPLPPHSDADQRRILTEELGAPEAVAERLWEWPATPAQREALLRALMRIKGSLARESALRQRSVRVYGRAHHTDRAVQAEEAGLLRRAETLRVEAVKVITDILELTTPYDEALVFSDPRLTGARPHLEAALRHLQSKGRPRPDPRLRGRVKGPPPAFVVTWDARSEPQPVTRREIEDAITALLRPFAPNPRAARVTTRALLDPILPRTWGGRIR